MFCGRAQGVHSTFWSLKTQELLIGVLPVGQLGYPSLTPTASHAGQFMTLHLFPLASCVSHDSAQPGISGSSAGLIDKVIERVLPVSWWGDASAFAALVVSAYCSTWKWQSRPASFSLVLLGSLQVNSTPRDSVGGGVYSVLGERAGRAVRGFGPGFSCNEEIKAWDSCVHYCYTSAALVLTSRGRQTPPQLLVNLLIMCINGVNSNLDCIYRMSLLALFTVLGLNASNCWSFFLILFLFRISLF